MIDIILATYNGERFLQEQLNSIRNSERYHNLVSRLIVVDDGSTDSTRQIVEAAGKQDSKIEWHVNTSGRSGAMGNFAFGLNLSSAAYTMLCDQDDIWLPEKIVISLLSAQKAEKSNKPNTPVLIFTDKYIVDENLNVLCESYFQLKQISKDWHHSFERLSQQNVASGCTMLMNRALLNKALPIPIQAYMHDWWLALVASRCGMIELIDKPLVKYRQHDNNTIGAKKTRNWQLVTQFPARLAKFKHSFRSVIEQAEAFQQFESHNDLPPNVTISTLVALTQMNKRDRLTVYQQGLITRNSTAGKIALIITLLTL